MTPVFADAGYWIALSSPSDSLHTKALAITKQIGSRTIITSEMVLTEYLDGAAGQGQYWRRTAATFVAALRNQGIVRIIPQTSELFTASLELYTQRPDKAWSLTDCASILICQQEGITAVLAHDHHFQQAGFITLLRDEG